MSNVMSLSKSRWKGAMLAAVSAATLAPVATQAAPVLTVSLTLSPLGTTPQTKEYIAPDTTVPVYVYATISGNTSGTTAGDGLQYLYYGINQTIAGTGQGYVTSAVLNPNFVDGAGANGSQVGTLPASATSTIAVGGVATSMTDFAKPRSASAVWSNAASGVVVSGNSVSFLVETLQYKPAFTAAAPSSNTPSSTLSLSLPTLGIDYPEANYFSNLSAPVVGQVGATNTFSNVVIGSSVTLTEAALGDVNLDGLVNSADIGVIAGNYGKRISGFTNGDLNADNAINSGDIGIVAQYYGQRYGPGVAGIVVPTASVGSAAVPEPTSLAVLAIAGMGLAARRRSRI